MNRLRIAAGFLVVLVTGTWAMTYDHNACADAADGNALNQHPNFHVWKYTYTLSATGGGADCAHFGSNCFAQGLPYKCFAVKKQLTQAEIDSGCHSDFPDDHKRAKYRFFGDGSLTWSPDFQNFLTKVLGCSTYEWTPGHHPSGVGDVQTHVHGVRRGDFAFWYAPGGSHHHTMIITDIIGNVIYYSAHSSDSLRANLLHNLSSGKSLRIVHVPDVIHKCQTPYYWWDSDSNFKYEWRSRHAWHCCWHEELGGQGPWSANPTCYPCLSWSESNGHTWDTLISSRMNMAGCSTVTVQLTSNATIAGGGGRTVEIRGSTDDGATWPYPVGDQATTSVDLPWATNQRNVRLAWIYVGTIQENHYWCIDDVIIWAKPAREHDASQSEIKQPRGIITQGKAITPTALVWNHGMHTDSSPVTMTIGSFYSDTRWVKLDPCAETLLEFNQWVAQPGSYTVTSYLNLPTDVFRGNDTAALTFRVVGDTWVSMFPVYGGGGMEEGACLAPTDTDNIYCAVGMSEFFAKYVVTQNLWKNRTPAPEAFQVGAGLAYPGTGPDLYAMRGGGSQSFFRYRSDVNYWEYLAPTPGKISQGGALVWGGGKFLYALRGYLSRSFYRYDIAADTWVSLAQTPGSIKAGGSLVWTGGDYLYALRGRDYFNFYRYQISTNTWTSLANTPVPVDGGGALAFYPQGNKLYAFFGGGGYYFYAYDILGDTWLSRGTTPGPVNYGGCLTYCDYSIFGGLGTGSDTNFWRYSPPVGGFDEPQPGTVPAGSPVERASVAAAGDVRVGDDGAFGEEVMTYDPTDKFMPDYSPSDSWITYTADDTNRSCLALYRIRSTGGPPQMVSYDSRTYENPKWSHSGAWLIAKGDDGIFRLDPTGTMSAARLTQGVTSLPRWSDNDSWVIYERWDTTLHTHRTCRVRTDGTMDTCLSIDASEYLSPQPVSDSEVVCVKLKDEVYQLCLVRNGQTIWLTRDYMNNTSPFVSPNRQWCTFEKLDESGYWQVYRIRLDGTDEARLSGGTCNCKTPTYSPDGHNIAYSKWPADSTGSSELSQICYVPDSGGQETALNQPNAIRKNPCWSNDCSYIVYQRNVESGSFGGGKKRHMQLARARTRIRYSGVEELKAIPTEFALYQNRPNPFHARTTIRYALPTPARADLTIYDIAGRSVKKLVQSEQKAGYYLVRWSGNDARGRSVPAGTYFYVLKANGKIAQKRMLLVR